jgi:hypothetical protein
LPACTGRPATWPSNSYPWIEPAVSHRRPQDRFVDAADVRLSWRPGQGGTLAPAQVQANGVEITTGLAPVSRRFLLGRTSDRLGRTLSPSRGGRCSDAPHAVRNSILLSEPGIYFIGPCGMRFSTSR